MKRLLLSLFLLQSAMISSLHVCVVVHGTWAAQETWWRPGGDFFQALYKDATYFCDDVVAFPWSGKNTIQARREAAVRLAKVIEQYDQVTIVAHSHGATVGILASHYLARDFAIYQQKNRFKITKFYALGVPVDMYDGLPEMNVIEQFYNIFSFNDVVQPVFGFFERTFTAHERIANLAITINDKEPTHSELHSPLVARDLLKIADYFFDYAVHGFEHFVYLRPGIVNFYDTDLPHYAYDQDREYLLECDKDMTELLLYALTRNKERYKNMQDKECLWIQEE